VEPLSMAGLGLGLTADVFKMSLNEQAAQMQRAAALENLRKQTLGQVETVGKTEAAIAGSGFETGGQRQGGGVTGGGAAGGGNQSSMGGYLQAMQAEFARERQFNQNQIEQGFQAQQVGAVVGGVTDFGSSIFSFGKANNWFMGSPNPNGATQGQ